MILNKNKKEINYLKLRYNSQNIYNKYNKKKKNKVLIINKIQSILNKIFKTIIMKYGIFNKKINN